VRGEEFANVVEGLVLEGLIGVHSGVWVWVDGG
jgi:hypothetical protein